MANDSRANYVPTFQSLASTLNLDYLEPLLKPLNRNSDDREPLRVLISQSTSSRFLRSFGYKFITFQTGIATTEIKNSDYYVAGRIGLNEFETALLLLTPLARLLHWFHLDHFEVHRQRQLHILDYLETMPREESPVFVFAHILACHPPFVFDQEGNRVADDIEKASIEGIPFPLYSDARAYRRSYIRQMAYFTARVRRILERLIQRSRRECIIILQSRSRPWQPVGYVDSRQPASLGNYEHSKCLLLSSKGL